MKLSATFIALKEDANGSRMATLQMSDGAILTIPVNDVDQSNLREHIYTRMEQMARSMRTKEVETDIKKGEVFEVEVDASDYEQ